MNWLIILRDERDVEVVAKHRYLGCSKRDAITAFRRDNGLQGKRISHRLYVEQLGAVV